MNPTPVAYIDVDGCLINYTSHPQNYTHLFTLDQLNQARVDALREAAAWFAMDGNYGNPAFVLMKMADEIEGEKK